MKSRETKRAEALIRQQKYNALTLAEKVERAYHKPGFCTKEITRLLKQA